MGDVLDPPRRRAKGEHVTDPRLVDHLLVELADSAPGPLARREEDGVQTSVGDRPTARHGQALGTTTPGERVGGAVPHDAGAQLGELVARVLAGEHVERRLEH